MIPLVLLAFFVGWLLARVVSVIQARKQLDRIVEHARVASDGWREAVLQCQHLHDQQAHMLAAWHADREAWSRREEPLVS